MYDTELLIESGEHWNRIT